MSIDMNALRKSIGAKSTSSDVVTASAVARLAATIGVKPPATEPGAALPPGWHAPFFGSTYGPEAMRPDGQAKGGGVMPEVPLPRHRLRGERTTFHDPIRIGDVLTRTTEVAVVGEEDGKAGPIVSLTVRSTTRTPRGLGVVEDREHFYAAADEPDGEAPAAPAGEMPWRRTVEPDPVLLFRYSAVRFNSHRVHYDRNYCLRVEKLPGLIVQATLTWQLMLELCRANAPARAVRELGYRLHRPIYDTGPFTLLGRPSADGTRAELWAVDQAGRAATTAVATFAE
jgi:3-methylfumaryl-CoA hydratase